MKKIILSAAVAAMAFSTSAMAADKGIDITTNGQAVVYYQTNDTNAVGDKGFFDQDSSTANVGIQLDLGADLGNNFTFGSQITYLGTAGLEKNLVGNVVQAGGTTVQGSTTDDLALTKIFIAKKIANTTLKIGRQELPKSLSPLAFSEGWNVFKNTFDAIVAINSDIPNTTLVGAYVSGGTAHTLGTTADLPAGVTKGAYMLTAQTTAIPMTVLTASYYHLSGIGATDGSAAVPAVTTLDSAGDTVTLSPAIAAVAPTAGLSADAIWIDAKIGKDLPMGLSIGAQYGTLDLDLAGAKETDAYGVKVSMKPIDALTLCAAYTDVNDGALGAVNYGTNVKSPLFTQMILNQNHIVSDNDTWMLKAGYSMGDMGSLTAQYAATSNNATANSDYNELDVIYKLNAGGVNYFASYSMTETENGVGTTDTDRDMIRLWARYNF